MKPIRLLAAVAIGLLVSASCSGHKKTAQSPTSARQTTAASDSTARSHALVVFFSHAGENYSVGTVKEGNTKLVADEVARLTGADVFEIVPRKSYDMPYDSLTRVAQDEAGRGELPTYKGDIDTAPYDTVFIGGPVWWGTYPRVMFTFFSRHDLNGKVIIPFTTHEGSGLGSVVNDLQRLYPHADITSSFSIAGHEVRSGKAEIDKWITGLK